MTLQQLSYLIKVAECGNITEAAEQLYISQPSLSTAISNLEKEMGVTAFIRTKKGVIVTHEGEELLSFARMLLEQADIMKEHFGVVNKREPKFSVSCQHYSFAVNAFVDVVNQFDADKYSFILRETQTGEIIDDVAYGKSELGILYLSDNNEEVISKLLKKNDLVLEGLIVAVNVALSPSVNDIVSLLTCILSIGTLVSASLALDVNAFIQKLLGEYLYTFPSL